MKTAILQGGYADRQDVQDLTLDDSFFSEDVEGLDGLNELKSLSMIKCGIKNLEDLPRLPELRKLTLSQNRIAGGLSAIARACPKLEQLILCDNKITNVEEFRALVQLKDLVRIDAEGCNVDGIEDIFEMFPSGQMQNVNGMNEKGDEIYSEDEVTDSDDDDDDDEEEEEEDDDDDDDDDDDEDDGKPSYAALVGEDILSDDDEDEDELDDEEDEASEDFDDDEDDEDEDDDEPAAKKPKA